MTVGLVGLLALDENVVGGVERRGFGGSVYYVSKALDTLGLDYRVLTAVGSDFPIEMFLEDVGYGGVFHFLRYSGPNLVFRNVYIDDSRVQYVRNHGYVFYMDVMLDFFCPSKPDVLAVLPIIGEVSIGDILVLSKYFDVAVDPQGLVRRVSGGRVSGSPIDPRYLSKCVAVKVSMDELYLLYPDRLSMEVFLDGYGGVFAVTMGREGSLIYLDDVYVYVPAPPVPRDADTTGAGDVYMAAILYGLVNGYSVFELGALASSLCYTLISSGVGGLMGYRSVYDELLDLVDEIGRKNFLDILYGR